MKRVIEILLGATVVVTAIAFGGVEPLGYSLMEIAVGTAVLLALIQEIRSGQINFPLPVWPILFVLLATLQILPLPPWLVHLLSPQRLLNLPPAAAGASGTSWIPLSVYPYATEVGLMKLLAYLGAFLLAAYLFDSNTRKSLLVWILIGLGCAEAIYGTCLYLTHTEWVLFYRKEYYLGVATGTYVNHNHYAGLLELCGAFVGASIFRTYRPRKGPDETRRQQRRSGSDTQAPRLLFWAFLMNIIIIGVILSLSRGGIISVLVSTMFMGMLVALQTRKKVWVTGLFLFLICMVGYGVWIGLGPALSRFEQIGKANYVQAEGRLSIWGDTYRMIRAYPVTGTGWGTFRAAFQGYQSSLVNFTVEHAHNDYLEVAAETGLVGAGLFWLPIFYVFAQIVHSFVTDHRRFRSAATLGCAGSTLALLVHSVMDFNLQIPANALAFAVILGIGYKASCLEHKEDTPPKPVGHSDDQGHQPSTARRPVRNRLQFEIKNIWVRRMLIFLGTVAFLAEAGWIAKNYAAFQLSQSYELRSLQRAAKLDPGNADYHLRLGRSYLFTSMDARPGQAVEEIRRGVQLDPYDPGGWTSLAEALGFERRTDEAERCSRRADLLAPNLPLYQWPIANFYLLQANVDEAFRHFRKVLAGASEYDQSIFSLAWKASGDSDKILGQLIPPNVSTEFSYLYYLLSEKRFMEAQAVWQRLMDGSEKFAPQLCAGYIDTLIGARQPAAAYKVWKDLEKKEILEGPAPGPRKNLVTNGDFEEEMLNMGFGWRIVPVEGVYAGLDESTFHSPSHSLLVQFQGKLNLDYRQAYEYVKVSPGVSYRLQAFLSTEGITTDSGPKLEVRDAYDATVLDKFSEDLTGNTPSWTLVTLEFTASPKTELIVVGLARLPSRKLDNQIAGRVWLDDVQLTPMTEEGHPQ